MTKEALIEQSVVLGVYKQYWLQACVLVLQRVVGAGHLKVSPVVSSVETP